MENLSSEENNQEIAREGSLNLQWLINEYLLNGQILTNLEMLLSSAILATTPLCNYTHNRNNSTSSALYSQSSPLPKIPTSAALATSRGASNQSVRETNSGSSSLSSSALFFPAATIAVSSREKENLKGIITLNGHFIVKCELIVSLKKDHSFKIFLKENATIVISQILYVKNYLNLAMMEISTIKSMLALMKSNEEIKSKASYLLATKDFILHSLNVFDRCIRCALRNLRYSNECNSTMVSKDDVLDVQFSHQSDALKDDKPWSISFRLSNSQLITEIIIFNKKKHHPNEITAAASSPANAINTGASISSNESSTIFKTIFVESVIPGLGSIDSTLQELLLLTDEIKSHLQTIMTAA